MLGVKISSGLVIVAMLACIATARAATTTYVGAGGQIIDSGLGCGNPLSVPTVFQTITIAGSPDAESMSVDLVGLKHGFLGDLEISLSGPGGFFTHLADRPGGTADSCGSPSDFLFTNSYRWDNSGGAFPEDPPTPLPSGFWHPTGDLGLLSTPLPTGDVNGDWILTIRDWKHRDFGSLSEWRINITEVPEPATAGLLAIALAGLIRRRRRD